MLLFPLFWDGERLIRLVRISINIELGYDNDGASWPDICFGHCST